MNMRPSSESLSAPCPGARLRGGAPCPQGATAARIALRSTRSTFGIRRRVLPAAMLLVVAFDALAATPDSARLFSLSDVRLLDGPFKHAQELNRRYILALEVDRLVAPFRHEAGLPRKAPKYPNWESSGLDGHTAGHYLTALAQMWAVTNDVELKRRLDYMVSELAACQRAGTDGYVGGIPNGRTLWHRIATAPHDAQGFSLNGAWVPWYNLHKLYAGLRDAWLLAGNEEARDVLVRLADWSDQLLAGLSDEQMQRMLGTEHGGMNEVLADVHAITGDPKYLRLAQRFSHRAILDPLLQGEDQLTGLHANTQIPKAIGFARIAELGGDPNWRDAAQFFWETVAARRSLAFGGNSEREHFNPIDDYSAVVESREGPETCNTYNMLRLTERLFRSEPAARFADFYERALYNHILSSQHPEHGGFVYFTPIRPRHYRVYSQPGTSFWCCVGTGIENHGKYGAFIYAEAKDVLFVNLFVASELNWRARGVRVRQDTSFPDESRTRLTVATPRPQRFALRIRHPGWVAGELGIRINGQAQTASTSASGYVEFAREWSDGDRVEVDLPMRTTLEQLPDGSEYAAVLRGPIVLAARTGTEDLAGLLAGPGRMAHIAPGGFLPLDRAPMLVGDIAAMPAKIRPVAGRPMTFTAAELVQPESARALELVPFYRVHDARYVMYWRTVPPNRYAAVVAETEARERAALALDARTIDRVTPGLQQPEVEHFLRHQQTNTGVTRGRHWRGRNGWFSYELKVAPAGPQDLVITLDGRERGHAFDLLVNDHVIATGVAAPAGEGFVEVTHTVPDELIAAAPNGALTVKFVPSPGTRIPAVFDVRVARREDGARQ